MYYVYLLNNRVTSGTYIGYTRDLKRRFVEHHPKEPELVYYEAYKSIEDARGRERMLKQRGQTARRLKERLKNSIR